MGHESYFPMGQALHPDPTRNVKKALSASEALFEEIHENFKLGLNRKIDGTQRPFFLSAGCHDLAPLVLINRRKTLPYLPALIRLLGDEDPQVVHDATMTIGLYGPHARSAVPPLIKVYRQVQAEDNRSWRVIEALGRIGDLRGRHLLLAALSKTGTAEGWRSAMAARLYLASQAAFVSEDIYLAHLKRTDKRARTAMIMVMELLAASRHWAKQALEGMSDEPDPEVRAVAMEAATRVRCRAMRRER